MAKLRLEEHISGDPDMEDKGVVGLIQDMEDKHSNTYLFLPTLFIIQNLNLKFLHVL